MDFDGNDSGIKPTKWAYVQQEYAPREARVIVRNTRSIASTPAPKYTGTDRYRNVYVYVYIRMRHAHARGASLLAVGPPRGAKISVRSMRAHDDGHVQDARVSLLLSAFNLV